MDKNLLTAAIGSSAAALEKSATALGDKVYWSPMDKGRTALNQIVECSGFMGLGAITITGKAFPAMTQEDRVALRDKAVADNATVEKALTTLRANAASLTDALSAASDADLQTVITLPFGGGMEKTIAEFISLIYWNSTYHEGQINYIETLI